MVVSVVPTDPASESTSQSTTMSSSYQSRSSLKSYRSKQHGRIYTVADSRSPSSSRTSSTCVSGTTRQSRYDQQYTRPRYTMSADRDLPQEVMSGERLMQASIQSRGRYPLYVDEDIDTRRSSRFGYSLDRYSNPAARVDRDAYEHIRHDLRQAKSSRFLNSMRPSAIKRTVEEVYDTRSSVARAYGVPSKASSIRSSSYEDARYRSAPRTSRSASLTRFGDLDLDYEPIRRPKRSSSVSRYENRVDENWEALYPRKTYGELRSEYDVRTNNVQVDRDLLNYKDLSATVVDQSGNFSPDDIRVRTLPSGKKAMTFTKFRQSGSGDKVEANNALQRVIQKTQFMEKSMSSLEEFVRRNRSLFPEDTRIYQQYTYFLLNEQQLREIGEPPDAQIYGVTIREKLVVPYGTDVTSLLGRYFKKSEVEVEYDGQRQRRGRQITTQSEDEVDYLTLQDNIRRKVEEEWEIKRQSRAAGLADYQVKTALRHRDQRDTYDHLHPHVTPTYIRTIYDGAGARYDDIYRRTRPGYEPATPSEQEPKRSTKPKKRLDATPAFTTRLGSKRCMEQQTIRFNCAVSGLPLPNFTWFHGNKIITDGGRYRITNDFGFLTLEISNVTKDDAGLYTVKATNVEGEVACSASLDVVGVDAEGDKDDGMRKPYFLVEPFNVWAEVGAKVVIEAQAKGKPAPTFRWLRDNIPIEESDRCKVVSDENGNTKLVIREAQIADSGLYFCIAENKAGKAKCAATFRVVDKGQEKPPMREREPVPSVPDLPERHQFPQAGRPWFVQLPPQEITLREGDPLTIKCVIDGDPKPVVTWFKGVRELTYSKRHRILCEGQNHYLLQIPSTLQTDPGQYIVSAENSNGRCQSTIWVNILPKDADIDEDTILRTLRLQLPDLEYDIEKTTEFAKTPPKFIKKLPLETEVSSGSSFEFRCAVQDETPIEEIRTTIDRKVMEGDYKLIETTHNLSKGTKQVEEIPLGIRVDAAPKILAPMSDVSVNIGGRVRLTLKVNMKATVVWSKDGKTIEDGGRFKVITEGKTLILEVADVTEADAGAYTVTISNDKGSDSATCSMNVLESVTETTSKTEPSKPEEKPAPEIAPVEEKSVEAEVIKKAHSPPIMAAPAEEKPVESDEEEPVPAEPEEPEKPAADIKAVDEEPIEADLVKKVEEKPEEKPTEVAPAVEKPTEVAPAEEKPTEGAPAEEKPTEGAPAEEKPTEGAPAEEKPVESDKKKKGPAICEPKPVKPEPVRPVKKKPAEDKPDTKEAESEPSSVSESASTSESASKTESVSKTESEKPKEVTIVTTTEAERSVEAKVEETVEASAMITVEETAEAKVEEAVEASAMITVEESAEVKVEESIQVSAEVSIDVTSAEAEVKAEDVADAAATISVTEATVEESAEVSIEQSVEAKVEETVEASAMITVEETAEAKVEEAVEASAMFTVEESAEAKVEESIQVSAEVSIDVASAEAEVKAEDVADAAATISITEATVEESADVSIEVASTEVTEKTVEVTTESVTETTSKTSTSEVTTSEVSAEKPAEEKPTEEKAPVEQKPVEEKVEAPVEEKPAKEKPAEEKPAKEEPSESSEAESSTAASSTAASSTAASTTEATTSKAEKLEETAEATIEVQETADAEAKIVVQETVEAEAKIEVQETEEAEANIQIQETVEAEAMIEVQETVEAEAKIVVQETAEAEAEFRVQETAEAEAEFRVQETAETAAEATLQVEETAEAEIRVEKFVEEKVEVEETVEVQEGAAAEEKVKVEIKIEKKKKKVKVDTEEGEVDTMDEVSENLESYASDVEVVEGGEELDESESTVSAETSSSSTESKSTETKSADIAGTRVSFVHTAKAEEVVVETFDEATARIGGDQVDSQEVMAAFQAAEAEIRSSQARSEEEKVEVTINVTTNTETIEMKSIDEAKTKVKEVGGKIVIKKFIIRLDGCKEELMEAELVDGDEDFEVGRLIMLGPGENTEEALERVRSDVFNVVGVQRIVIRRVIVIRGDEPEDDIIAHLKSEGVDENALASLRQEIAKVRVRTVVRRIIITGEGFDEDLLEQLRMKLVEAGGTGKVTVSKLVLSVDDSDNDIKAKLKAESLDDQQTLIKMKAELEKAKANNLTVVMKIVIQGEGLDDAAFTRIKLVIATFGGEKETRVTTRKFVVTGEETDEELTKRMMEEGLDEATMEKIRADLAYARLQSHLVRRVVIHGDGVDDDSFEKLKLRLSAVQGQGNVTVRKLVLKVDEPEENIRNTLKNENFDDARIAKMLQELAEAKGEGKTMIMKIIILGEGVKDEDFERIKEELANFGNEVEARVHRTLTRRIIIHGEGMDDEGIEKLRSALVNAAGSGSITVTKLVLNVADSEDDTVNKIKAEGLDDNTVAKMKAELEEAKEDGEDRLLKIIIQGQDLDDAAFERIKTEIRSFGGESEGAVVVRKLVVRGGHGMDQETLDQIRAQLAEGCSSGRILIKRVVREDAGDSDEGEEEEIEVRRVTEVKEVVVKEVEGQQKEEIKQYTVDKSADTLSKEMLEGDFDSKEVVKKVNVVKETFTGEQEGVITKTTRIITTTISTAPDGSIRKETKTEVHTETQDAGDWTEDSDEDSEMETETESRTESKKGGD